MRFGERETTKQKFHASKKPIKVLDINFDNNRVISKVVKTKLIVSISLE